MSKNNKRQGYYHHGYGNDTEDSGAGICDQMSFTAAEAYKMLRTKINLIIPQEINEEDFVSEDTHNHKCRIVGVTSALRGEGKTTSSINLAYTIAEAGRKVCLLEADMRLPNINKRLNVEPTPGLSNILTGQCGVQTGIQRYVSKGGVKVYVVTAGDIPPTPSELLESSNMDATLSMLSQVFDVIVVDLPPVTAVTDTLAVAPKLHGMLIVVREGYCDKYSLRDVMGQLKLADTKVLGVVLNCSEGSDGSPTHYHKGNYYKNKYYKDKHKYYYESKR